MNVPSMKILGQPPEVGRWLLIPLGMTVLLCLGTVYSWSIFRIPLEQELGLNATASLIPYTLALLFYSLLMPITGFYIPQLGAQLVTAIGGLIVGLGYIWASFAQDLLGLALSYGVLAGMGIGIAYGVPMAVSAHWFPDRKGLAVGLTIVGFGLSPIITAPLANWLITVYGVRPTLRILGVVFTGIILAVSLAMRLPPPNWSPPTKSNMKIVETVYSPSLWRSRAFYGLWLCYALGTFVGLSAIGISSSVGQEVVQISPEVGAMSVALFALCNGVSRPLFGWLSDRFPPRYVAMFSYILILIGAVVMIPTGKGQVGNYLLAFCLFWFCLGGWLAMAPTITLRFFHPAQYAQNYGIVFTAYGCGALTGTLSAGQIRDWFGSYNFMFAVMAGLAIAGIFLAWGLLKPDRCGQS